MLIVSITGPQIRRTVATVAALASLALPRLANGQDCGINSEYSSCFEADNLWLSPNSHRFVSISGGHSLAAFAFSVGVGTSYLSKPITLRAPSPDPDDRTIRVVDKVLNTTFLFAIGLGNNLEASLAAPVGLYQSGSGIKGITSQRGEPLSEQALHDPRIGISASLHQLVNVPGLSGKARLELSLPIGQEDRFAGARGFSLHPAFSLLYERKRFFTGVEIGVRLRQAVPFAGVRVGSQLWTALGFGVDILDPERLSVVAEAWLLPSLVGQQPAAGNRRAVHVSFIPAEWLLSLRSRPIAETPWVLQIGFGTGLPLSTETRVDETGDSSDYFLGVTAPEFRGVLIARYAPITE